MNVQSKVRQGAPREIGHQAYVDARDCPEPTETQQAIVQLWEAVDWWLTCTNGADLCEDRTTRIVLGPHGQRVVELVRRFDLAEDCDLTELWHIEKPLQFVMDAAFSEQ